MSTQQLYSDTLWPYLLAFLPPSYEELAEQHHALRRCRKVPNAAALLRMILVYALTDLSYKDVAAWAAAGHVAEISGPALFYRLCDAEAWLAALLAEILMREVQLPSPLPQRLCLVDATVLTGPGATGTEWRLHTMVDPVTGRFQRVELTDASGGESLARYPLQPQDIVLGDRGYAHARGIASVVKQQAHVVVRANPQAMRLCRPDRTVFSVLAEQEAVPTTGVMTWDILIPVPPEPSTRSHKSWALSKASQWIPARIGGIRARTGEIIWILTTLPAAEMSMGRCFALYRLRWQVELVFKRLKSLLDLDALPSRQGPTARSWIYARLVAAAIAQQLLHPSGAFSPWGYPLGAETGSVPTECLVTVSHDALGVAYHGPGAVGA